MNSLITYLKQRVNVGLWIAVTLFLIYYSHGYVSFKLPSVADFLGVFVFLILMRLFDDLHNAKRDINKPNRNYTDAAERKKLVPILILCFVIYLAVIFLNELTLGVYVTAFLLINLVLYAALNRFNTIAYFLPLLKYFFVASMLQNVEFINSTALFFMFVVFESLDDVNFLKNKLVSLALLFLAYLLLILQDGWPIVASYNLLAVSVLTTISFAMAYSKFKYQPYVILILFLISRLII